jgi:hypothetical protein
VQRFGQKLRMRCVMGQCFDGLQNLAHAWSTSF